MLPTSIPVFALQVQFNDLFLNIVHAKLFCQLLLDKPCDVIMHIIFLRPKLVFLLILMVILSACEAITTTHGRLIEPAELDRLELGETTQAETIAILGPPSFEGAFNSGRLYYNNQKMENRVGGETLTIERELIIFIFDNRDRLQSIEIRDKTSDKKIVKLESKTPTPGDTITIVDQLFSNLRRRNLD